MTGSGGKTTALFQLARTLSGGSDHSIHAAREKPVIVTATTHLHTSQVGLADTHWIAEKPADLADLEKNLYGVMLVTGPLDGDRTTGLNEKTISWLRAICKTSFPANVDRSRRFPATSAQSSGYP